MFLRQTARYLSHGRQMSSLVIAERSGNELSGGTLSTITAATQLGQEVTVLVSGTDSEAVGKAAANVNGVSKVLVADNAAYDKVIAENMTNLVVGVQKANSYTHIFAPATNAMKNFMPRVSAILDVAALSEVISVIDESTFERPMYAGNAIAKVKSNDSVKICTVRATAFEKAAATGGSAAVEAAPQVENPDAGLSTFESEEVSKSDRPDLTSAPVVVAGGRGMKSGENFAMLEALADKLGGAVGASRAAVDAGYVPNEYQVGQTGKVVAPDLYIAVGISGAIQHLAGMKDSKTIVCINKDEEAPIFQVSDYGLVDDLFKAVPELTEKV